jgi:3-oxoacyl-[acyl-carrier protein] reductase
MPAMEDLLSLQGRTALVTGGGRGIGAAIVRAFHARGAQVLFTYRSDEASARALEQACPGTIALQSDAALLPSAEQAVARAIEAFGGLHIVVANAGIARDRVCWKLNEADFDAVIDTNLKGVFAVVRAAVPHLRNQSGGRIIAISSINGIRGKGGQSVYAASKAGVIAFIKSVARETGSKNITANVVAPGFIRTDMTADLPDDVVQKAVAETALGRAGTPENVADAVLFLASDLAAHITGQVLHVDGGQLM